MKQFAFIFGVILLCSFTVKVIYTESGTASYYSNKFKGRKTSSGALYHPDSLFCAHKTLKFGTILKVTNTKNDSIVYVRVVDRLGKSSSRIIDLSMAGAKQLNFVRQGLTKVTLESIP